MTNAIHERVPKIFCGFGAAFLVCKYSKYVPFLKSSEKIKNLALRINLAVPFSLLSSGLSLEYGKRVLGDELRRAQEDKATSDRQIEDLNRQLTESQAEADKTKEELKRAQEDKAAASIKIEGLNKQLETSIKEIDKVQKKLDAANFKIKQHDEEKQAEHFHIGSRASSVSSEPTEHKKVRQRRSRKSNGSNTNSETVSPLKEESEEASPSKQAAMKTTRATRRMFETKAQQGSQARGGAGAQSWVPKQSY